MQLLDQSWQRAWAAIDVQPATGLFTQLIASYSEPHRKYHTLQHLQECLEKLQTVLALAEHAGELELALWFHDAIYELKRQDNETQSALWAKQAIIAAGGSPEAASRVYRLVLASKHSACRESNDERLLVDIDLSILGTVPARFDEYERQVREEYAWVPDALFCEKRRTMLQAFLDRDQIYTTEHFQQQLEANARGNLLRSIKHLEG